MKLRRERIVVALEHKVLVYDFKDLKLLHSIETLSNPMGLVALSPSQDQTVMACPGLHCGQVSSACYADYEAFVSVSGGFAHLIALGLALIKLRDCHSCQVSGPYRVAQDRLLWTDKTCPAYT